MLVSHCRRIPQLCPHAPSNRRLVRRMSSYSSRTKCGAHRSKVCEIVPERKGRSRYYENRKWRRKFWDRGPHRERPTHLVVARSAKECREFRQSGSCGPPPCGTRALLTKRSAVCRRRNQRGGLLILKDVRRKCIRIGIRERRAPSNRRTCRKRRWQFTPARKLWPCWFRANAATGT